MSDIIKTIRAEILQYRNKSAEELGVGFLESNKAKTFTNGGVAWVCERLLAFLDSLSEQPVEGLEEAAKQYAVLPMDVGEGKVCIDRKLESAFKAGAKWQAEQGVTAIGHFSGCWIDNRKWYSDTIQLHKDVEICEEWLEDKVQIQIRKKDE